MRCQIMGRIGDGDAGEAEMRSSLPPLGFFPSTDARAIGGAEDVGKPGRDREVGGRPVLIFSVDSAADVWGAGGSQPEADSKTKKKGKRGR